jgi:hypothetical protein
MTNSYPFNTVYDLPEIQFIAGSDQELIFGVYTSASVPVDLSGATISWHMSYYGQPFAILSKTGYSSGSSNYFSVYLTDTDTATLPEHKYTHQYTITDTSGSKFTPSQGIINLIQLIA